MPIPAVIGALAALAGSVLSNKFASDSQERSITAQRGLQNQLLNGGAQMARTAKQSGLSPAFSLGSASTPTAPAVASNFSPVDTSGFQSLLGGISQRKLQRQQEKVAKAQEDTQLAQARIAQNEADKSDIDLKNYRNQMRVFEDSEGTVDENGNVVVSANRELQGKYGEFVGNLEKQKMQYENSTYGLKILQNDWESKVYNGRINNPQILNAVTNMPLYEQDELIERINNFREDVKLKRTQEALNGCMSIYYMLAGSLAQANTSFVQQNTAENKAGSANELIENFSIKQLGKYLVSNGPQLIGDILGLRNPTKKVHQVRDININSK